MEDPLAQSVYRVGYHQHHRNPTQDVRVHREHAEGAKSHVVEVHVIKRREIHDHSDADEQCNDDCAYHGTETPFSRDCLFNVHLSVSPFSLYCSLQKTDNLTVRSLREHVIYILAPYFKVKWHSVTISVPFISCFLTSSCGMFYRGNSCQERKNSPTN